MIARRRREPRLDCIGIGVADAERARIGFGATVGTRREGCERTERRGVVRPDGLAARAVQRRGGVVAGLIAARCGIRGVLVAAGKKVAE